MKILTCRVKLEHKYLYIYIYINVYMYIFMCIKKTHEDTYIHIQARAQMSGSRKQTKKNTKHINQSE